MRRVKDYLKIIAWQTGLGYLLLWAITFWTLDEGANVFGKSGVCYPDAAKVLFYWVCDASSPLAILATVVNVALTVTVWAPVYVAAATVRPDAMAIAVPIVATHIIGLPLAMFVLMRMMVTALDLRRRIPVWRRSVAGADADAAGVTPVPRTSVGVTATATPHPKLPSPASPVKAVPPRSEFGLRGQQEKDRKPKPDNARRKG